MAELGIGVLVIPQKPWEASRTISRNTRGLPARWAASTVRPRSRRVGVLDESADKAEEMARRCIGANYESVMRHYEFEAAPHQGVKGYEFYTGITSTSTVTGPTGRLTCTST